MYIPPSVDIIGLEVKTMWLNELKKLKKQARMTHDEIAQASGVPVSTVEKIFSGYTADPKLETVRKIVTAMGYTLDDLLPQEGAPRKHSEEMEEYMEVLRTRSGVRALVSMAKDATDEEVEQALAIIEALRKKTARR